MNRYQELQSAQAGPTDQSFVPVQPRVREVAAAVDAIAFEIEVLSKEVDQLSAQLSPVLNHAKEDEAYPGESKVGLRCEMGAALHQQVERVRKLAGVVRSISIRLEV